MESRVRTGIGTFVTVFGGLVIVVTLVIGSRWYIDQRIVEEAKNFKSKEPEIKSEYQETLIEETSPSTEHQNFGSENQ